MFSYYYRNDDELKVRLISVAEVGRNKFKNLHSPYNRTVTSFRDINLKAKRSEITYNILQSVLVEFINSRFGGLDATIKL